jgi:hypothetical protein
MAMSPAVQSRELPKTEIRHVCPGCQRSLPFTTEHFSFCLRCSLIFCREKCMRTCFCGTERCYLCLEEIERIHRTSGLICEKCAMFLHHGNRNEGRQ